MNGSIGTDLTCGPVHKQLLLFSIPFMLANLLQAIYNLVDAVVVGRFLGAESLSGVTNGGEIITFFTFIAIGFGAAGQTMIGQAVGAKDRRAVNDAIGTLFTSVLILAAAVTIICILFSGPMLHILQLPDDAFSHGCTYLLYCSAGMIFIFGYNIVGSVLRGMGDSKRPLIFVAVASVVNLLLDLVFVALCHMGVAGAALATVFGQGLSFLISMVYLYQKRDLFGFDFKAKSFVPKPKLTLTLFRLGIPMSAQYALVSLSMMFIFSQINRFGVAASAANGIANRVNTIARTVASAMNAAGAAMVAQNIGAGRQDRIHSIAKWDFLISLAAAVACMAILILFPRQVFGLFTSDAEVIAIGCLYAVPGALDFLAGALRAPCMSIVNGTGAATLGLVSGLMDGVVARIGLALLFDRVFRMGIQGFWISLALASFVSVIVSAPYYLFGFWKKKKFLVSA